MDSNLQRILKKKQEKLLAKQFEKQQQQKQENQTVTTTIQLNKVRLQKPILEDIDLTQENKKLKKLQNYLTVFPKSQKEKFEQLPKEKQDEIKQQIRDQFSAELVDHYICQQQDNIRQQLENANDTLGTQDKQELERKLQQSYQGIKSQLYQDTIKEIRENEKKNILRQQQYQKSGNKTKAIKTKSDPLLMYTRPFKISIEDKYQKLITKKTKKYEAQTSQCKIDKGSGYLIIKRTKVNDQIQFEAQILDGQIQVEDVDQLKLTTSYGQPRMTEEESQLQFKLMESRFKGSGNQKELKEQLKKLHESKKKQQVKLEQQNDSDQENEDEKGGNDDEDDDDEEFF